MTRTELFEHLCLCLCTWMLSEKVLFREGFVQEVLILLPVVVNLFAQRLGLDGFVNWIAVQIRIVVHWVNATSLF